MSFETSDTTILFTWFEVQGHTFLFSRSLPRMVLKNFIKWKTMQRGKRVLSWRASLTDEPPRYNNIVLIALTPLSGLDRASLPRCCRQLNRISRQNLPCYPGWFYECIFLEFVTLHCCSVSFDSCSWLVRLPSSWRRYKRSPCAKCTEAKVSCERPTRGLLFSLVLFTLHTSCNAPHSTPTTNPIHT